MYLPEHFREDQSERVTALIEGHPFGTLVTAREGLPYVSHLPFLFERHAGPHGKLYCHLARANPHWQQLAPGQTVLAVFQGPHAYVSPAWYASPGVPTWNYAVAHLHGAVRLIEEAAELAALVEKLAAVHEAKYAQPWQSDLTAEQKAQLPRMIIGLEIEVAAIQGKFKLSQNRSSEDQQRVIAQLRQSESPLEAGVAALMAANLEA